MSLASNIHELLMGGSTGTYSYTINNSLRFRSSASAYLSRTPSVAGNRKTWTYSVWIKKGSLSADENLIAGERGNISFYDASGSNQLVVNLGAGSTNYVISYANAFRDPSAWYHFLFSVDTTQANASDRCKVYANNVQLSPTGAYGATYPPQNWDTGINLVSFHSIGASYLYSSFYGYYDGYMAEINLIDGLALDPSYFGATNTTTGTWAPKAYTGSYGTNGFYLPFSDTSGLTSGSNTGIGKDFSGNGNYWTTNNISLTAGSTYDAMLDSPTPKSSTVGNYAVLNAASIGTDCTLSDGNLSIAYGSAGTRYATMATIGMSSGKWYAEFAYTGGSIPMPVVGLSSKASSTDMIYYPGYTAYGWSYYIDGTKYNNGTGVAYGATWTTNDVIGIAFDADAGTLSFYKNGVSQGVAFSSLTSGPYYFAIGDGSGTNTFTGWFNFGQRPFAYTPPTGYKALQTYNLPTPTIKKGNQHFDATLYTGNGATQSIVNSGGFQPDLVWGKDRSTARSNALIDSVRGVTNTLLSNATDAEYPYVGLTAFNANGFSIGSHIGLNASSDAYVAWQWKGGGTAVTNTNGSITSQVSANPTAGFSVVTYTGNGSAGATIGHGLGVAPSMVIVKARANATGWVVGHAYLNGGSSPWNYYLSLESTAAQGSTNLTWNNTAPTSTVFSLGSGSGTNPASTMVAYCFAAIPGYSAFGSYTGNGSSDGPFVFAGFLPRWVMIKRTDSTSDWIILDTSRNTYNVMNSGLWADLSSAEGTYTICDYLSNGFKLRDASNGYNTSGGTYIWAAFASNPFQYSLAR